MSAASIIIIIDETVARLNAIKAAELANMRADKLDAIEAELVDAKDLAEGAAAIAGV